MREPDVRESLDAVRQTPGLRLARCASDFEHYELRNAVQECLADDPDTTVGDFLSWIDIASRNDGPASFGANTGVTVTTFHRAKGLEWPVVFLAGVEEGLVPFGGVDSAQAEEERRLFYVAITRARERLILTWAKERESVDRAPSPWLIRIENASGPTEPELDASSIHDLIEQSRSNLASNLSDRNESRTGIERWRAARARLAGVEPHLILGDSVIDSIVELHPATKEELASIEGFGAVRAASVGNEILAVLQGQ